MKFKNSLTRLCILFLVLFSVVFVCGWGFRCKKHDALLLFNSQPITNQTINQAGRHFKAGEKVYYILINEEGFKDEDIRDHIVKKESKTNHWGYKIYWSKDFEIDTSLKYFKSYFVIDEPGYYFMQIFSFDDFDWPIIRNDFWINAQ